MYSISTLKKKLMKLLKLLQLDEVWVEFKERERKKRSKYYIKSKIKRFIFLEVHKSCIYLINYFDKLIFKWMEFFV